MVRTQFTVRDHHVHTRIRQNEIHLVGFEEIIDRDDNRAGFEDAKEGGYEFGQFLSQTPTRSPGWTLKSRWSSSATLAHRVHSSP